MMFRRLAGIAQNPIARRIAIAAVCVAVLAGISYAATKITDSQHNKDVVRAYCSGAVSEAQYQGCLHHVTRARIDQLANQGDQTAIKAENVDCSTGNAFQEGDC